MVLPAVAPFNPAQVPASMQSTYNAMLTAETNVNTARTNAQAAVQHNVALDLQTAKQAAHTARESARTSYNTARAQREAVRLAMNAGNATPNEFSHASSTLLEIQEIRVRINDVADEVAQMHLPAHPTATPLWVWPLLVLAAIEVAADVVGAAAIPAPIDPWLRYGTLIGVIILSGIWDIGYMIGAIIDGMSKRENRKLFLFSFLSLVAVTGLFLLMSNRLPIPFYGLGVSIIGFIVIIGITVLDLYKLVGLARRIRR